MKDRSQKTKGEVLGFILFLLPLSFTITFGIIIYVSLDNFFESRFVVVMFTVMYIVFAALVFYLIDIFRRKKTVTAPTEQILDATERIARGDFSVRIYPNSGIDAFTEYAAIMENVNKMASELSKSEMLKSEFISNVSHEIKTPLSIIKSYASALKAPNLDKETREKYVDVLGKTSERLSVLVTDILKLNKLENRTILPEKTEVSVNELLCECVLRYEQTIEKKELEIDTDIDDITVFVEPNLLDVVFANLISNAIKFSKQGGAVKILLKDNGKDFTFTVKDNGIGIKREVGERIFEKFYQADASRSSEGNGLGLALVKRVVDVLGGKITVTSEFGKGSTFTVTVAKGN